MNAINRIILVGNGFDLAHGLATRYADFINWYWEKYLNHLRMCHNRTYSDHLCTFILNDNHNTWNAFLWSILNPIKLPSGQEFYEHIKSDEKNFTIHYSAFMKRICQSIESKGWVDIENEYYTALNEEYFETPEKINEEFEIIKSNLIEYLNDIQEKDITTSIIEHKLQEKILSPIMISEVAISARRQLIDFIQARSTLDEQHLINESALSIHDVLKPDEDDNRISLAMPREKELARTPQQENLKNQLSKLGNTPFEAESVEIVLSDNWFIPSSELSDLRRRAVEKLLEARRINYPREVWRVPETHHAFPAQELTYLGNVMNGAAAAFYHDHGVRRIAPAFEKEAPEKAVLMFCKHCLRYSMGWCPVHHKVRSPYREPYFLVSSDGKRFRLQFDCKLCQMKVYAEE